MFDAGPIGTLPARFEPALTGKGQIGLWGVVEDPTAEHGRALEQHTPDETDNRFPLAIYTPVSAANVEVSVRFKPMYGKVDQAGGVAIRLLDPNTYYVARANALENNVRFYRVVGGRRELLEGVETKVAPREWHTLSLSAKGSKFIIGFDGRELFTAMDTTFGAEGRVAVWTKADSITRFDRVEIRSFD